MIYFDNTEQRFVLIGTIHGAFGKCDNKLPGIYVMVDKFSILQFLYKEAFGSGKNDS